MIRMEKEKMYKCYEYAGDMYVHGARYALTGEFTYYSGAELFGSVELREHSDGKTYVLYREYVVAWFETPFEALYFCGYAETEQDVVDIFGRLHERK